MSEAQTYERSRKKISNPKKMLRNRKKQGWMAELIASIIPAQTGARKGKEPNALDNTDEFEEMIAKLENVDISEEDDKIVREAFGLPSLVGQEIEVRNYIQGLENGLVSIVRETRIPGVNSPVLFEEYAFVYEGSEEQTFEAFERLRDLSPIQESNESE